MTAVSTSTTAEPAHYYVAYGSNLHPLRLQQRLPGAEPVARLRLDGRALRFHKRGADGSGKCDLLDEGSGCFGVLYRLQPTAPAQLDLIEGGYRRYALPVVLGGQRLEAFSYAAQAAFIAPALQPFDWYRDLILAGAEALAFEQDYCARLAAQSCVADPDTARRRAAMELVQTLRSAEITALRALPWGRA